MRRTAVPIAPGELRGESGAMRLDLSETAAHTADPSLTVPLPCFRIGVF
jgi:hypothetical protein